MYNLGQADMCGQLLPYPELLTYGSLLNEAISSSTIEGTIASPEELVQYQIGIVQDRAQVREVENYQQALRDGFGMLLERPISINLILKLHETLLAGVRGAGAAGLFKSHQNLVGWDAARQQPVYIPPPPEMVKQLMSQLERYLNNEQSEPRLVQIALCHYQFESIHPFGDGNGRVGRLVIVLQLMQLGILKLPLVYPSVYFERNRAAYYAGLQGVRERGDWVTWIDYIVDALSVQAHETTKLANLLLRLQRDLREEIRNVRAHGSVQRVLEAFFHKPVLSAAEVASMAGLARNTAKSALAKLVQMGYLSEMRGPRNARVYLCSSLFSALSKPTQHLEAV